MVKFERILVDIDAGGAVHPALDQAFDLAARCGATLKVVDVVEDVPRQARRYLPENLERDLVSLRQDQLARVAADLDQRGVPIETGVLRGSHAVAIIEDVLRLKHDLVIRSHGRDAGEEKPAYGAMDMHLLRKCPCPVWLVRPETTRRPQRVVAAVHASPDDPVEQRLNRKILELALTIVDLEHGTLTVLQAWKAFGEGLLKSRLSAHELGEYAEAARRTASEDLTELMSAFGDRLAGARRELVEGLPEDVIPSFAAKRQADMVVMGTIARSGIAGLVMGNTAERVLQRLRCPVMAVKPDGFVSPVTRPPMVDDPQS